MHARLESSSVARWPAAPPGWDRGAMGRVLGPAQGEHQEGPFLHQELGFPALGDHPARSTSSASPSGS